jgi:hypothetical protein
MDDSPRAARRLRGFAGAAATSLVCLVMNKSLAWGVVLVLALAVGAWVYLFHDFIEGDRVSWVKYKFGISVSPVVMVGRDGWLFAPGSPGDIDDYRGVARPDKKQLGRLREVLTQRNDFVRSLGGRFVYVIGPMGETLYNEFLPPQYRQVGNRRRATIALEELRDSGVEMLYLTPAVARAKNRGRVFYKYESHWNRLGSYVGSLEVISHLSQHHPAMKKTLARVSDFDLVHGPPVKNMWNTDRNYGSYLGVTLLEPDPEPVPKGGWTARMETRRYGKYGADVFTKDDPSLPTLVMFGDSFMQGMRKVMAENFRRAVFLNPWLVATYPLPETFTDFPAEVLEAEKPDVVIYERWERSFMHTILEWAPNAKLRPAGKK